jgi:hypothetical protein
MSPASSDASMLAVAVSAPLRPTLLAVHSCTRQHANLLVPGQIISGLVQCYDLQFQGSQYTRSNRLTRLSRLAPYNHKGTDSNFCVGSSTLGCSCSVVLTLCQLRPLWECGESFFKSTMMAWNGASSKLTSEASKDHDATTMEFHLQLVLRFSSEGFFSGS